MSSRVNRPRPRINENPDRLSVYPTGTGKAAGARGRLIPAKEVLGEGLVGVARGFMHAGASSVVASLWKVDDLATAEFMKIFYKGMLNDKLPPAAALRRAQIEMNKRRPAPYFWAGFILQGAL